MAAIVPPQAQQLDLAHVLCLDLAGSSSLPALQYRAALQNLQEFVQRTSEFGRARAMDQISVVPSGDGMAFVFSGDPEAPLRCAVEISRTIPGTERSRLRMGLHSWPAGRMTKMKSSGAAAEKGIDLAHRVMDCGDQGHILVSESVVDLLRQLGRWNSALHDLGEIEVHEGVRLHLFNFWNSEAGNPEVPNKFFRWNSQKNLDLPRNNNNSNKDRSEGGILRETVSHYRILRRLGSGGMGIVYEAEDTRLGRHVAVKLLPERFSQNTAAIERFQREACTASSLNHPNICTVHDVGEHAGRRFIVMELLEGKTLRQELLSGPLTPEQTTSFGTQIADGLEAAHKRGIVHRDIKPANLFVIDGERIKILDFGLAKLTGRDRRERAPMENGVGDDELTQSVTGPGEFLGTVSYTSPEQARGELLDHRTDLFSFGVVLYEMATGLLPFRGETSAVVFDSILNRPPAPATRINPQVSPELDRVICRALEKHRELRYQSAADMGAELRRLAMRTSGSMAMPVLSEPEARVVTLPPDQPAVKSEQLQVVLLYRRNVLPDEQIMRVLEDKFAARGYRVFVDRHLAVGVDWATEIEKKIGTADAVVALLSEASMESEMLSYEVQLAHSFSERQNGKPHLLPVRVQFKGEFPDSLHAALDGRNVFVWKNAADNDQIVADLTKALQTPPEALRHKPNLEPVGGALPLDSKFYIVRPTDQEFYSAVGRNDSIILLKGARQMGKTSLMARGLQQARKAGARVVLTDFQKLNSAHLKSVDSLFLCLAQAIAEQLDLDLIPEDSWNARRGPSMNFERFLRREILSRINGHLVWGMDEVDRLFACDFGSEVFGLFRSWHNERSLDPSGPWKNLSLAIAYASEAHLFITDVNQSPFNVGTRLVLSDFTLDQVRELNRRYGFPLSNESELERFYTLLGGQPFLTQRGLHQMTERGLPFIEFAAGAARDEGPYGDHLRRIFVSLNQDPALCEVVRDVIGGKHSSSTDSFYRLRSSGIVAGECARDMKLRCQLYDQYLSRHLI
jgi:serine/threonine protein kinase